MTDGGDVRVPHWHINNYGKLELGVQGPKGRGWLHYHSPQIFTADALGQWTHLAVVYDHIGNRVAHYVNGQLVQEETMQLDLALRIGDAELGNWNMARHRNPSAVRFFTGCMDEFLLFSRALSDEEIERHCLEGRPQE